MFMLYPLLVIEEKVCKTIYQLPIFVSNTVLSRIRPFTIDQILFLHDKLCAFCEALLSHRITYVGKKIMNRCVFVIWLHTTSAT